MGIGWYQTALRAPRGRRERGVVFRMLMVNTGNEGRMQNAKCRMAPGSDPRATC
jgi:hypothetical protein